MHLENEGTNGGLHARRVRVLSVVPGECLASIVEGLEEALENLMTPPGPYACSSFYVFPRTTNPRGKKINFLLFGSGEEWRAVVARAVDGPLPRLEWGGSERDLVRHSPASLRVVATHASKSSMRRATATTTLRPLMWM